MKHFIIEQVKDAIRNPTFTSQDMAELHKKHLVMWDGGMMCVACAKKNFRKIVEETKDGMTWNYTVAGVQAYWTGPPRNCDECDLLIEPEVPSQEEDKSAKAYFVMGYDSAAGLKVLSQIPFLSERSAQRHANHCNPGEFPIVMEVALASLPK